MFTYAHQELITNTYQKKSRKGFTTGQDAVGYESSERNNNSRLTHNTHNTMQKLITERFDAQNCTVQITSSEITVKNESHRIEVRYLDESDLLAAVCNYIELRSWDRNAEDKQRKLLQAINTLGKKIDAAKAEAKA